MWVEALTALAAVALLVVAFRMTRPISYLMDEILQHLKAETKPVRPERPRDDISNGWIVCGSALFVLSAGSVQRTFSDGSPADRALSVVLGLLLGALAFACLYRAGVFKQRRS